MFALGAVRPPLIALAAILLVLAAACGTPAPSTEPVTPSPTRTVAASVAPSAPGSGVRPIVIDTDMGMDDLLAIYILLRDPAVDVLAIAIDGTGLVHCGAGERNLRRILAAFDRLDVPFGCGREDAGPDGTPFPEDWRASSDAMYGVVLPPVVTSTDPPDAVTLLRDAIASAPSMVTVVALGPWTNLQDLLAADPAAFDRVLAVHAMAGALDVPGNMEVAGITPADGVEWNVGADPDSMGAVLATSAPVTLVPLDATDEVPVPPDVVAQLSADHAAAGANIAYETYARTPYLRAEGNYWWDPAAAVALTDPSLLSWEDAAILFGDRGRLMRAATSGRPVRIATGADTERTQAAILSGLRLGTPRPEPFEAVGTVRVSWDGVTCRMEPDAPTRAGFAMIELVNTSQAPVGLVAAGVRPPQTWADAVAWVASADLASPDLVVPDWLVGIEGEGPQAGPGATAITVVGLPPPMTGFMCATGEWPQLTFTDAGGIRLED